MISIPKEKCLLPKKDISKRNDSLIDNKFEVTMLNSLTKLPLFIGQNKLFFSSCMDTVNVDEYDYFNPQHKQKYLYVLREYSDWYWAIHNFWCLEYLDANCTNYPNRWLRNTRNAYRSPELFHELLVGTMKGSFSPVKIDFMRFTARPRIEAIVKRVGKERVLILKSEELSDSKTWQKISSFTGLNSSHHKLAEVLSVKFNTNENPGHLKKTETRSTKRMPGVYKVSGYRPLLNKTRILINELFYNDCMWLKENFNVYYNC